MNRLILFAIILLSSCTSLNKVESTREKNTQTNEYNYSDPESQIRYQITNDAKNLHIKLNTADAMTIMKVLRTGLKICFDVNGKKNQKVYFKYPLAQNRQYSDLNRSTSGNQERSTTGYGEQRRFDLNKMIAQIPKEGEFDRNGEKERILIMSADSDIKAYIKAINNDEIIYDVFIPLNRISKEGIATLSKLSIGIVTEKMATTSMGGGRSGSMGGGGRSGGMGGGRSGGMGGGGRGGMGGGGRSGGGMSGEGGSGGMDRSAMAKPIDIWFKLDLLKN